ncbi:putative methyltransferase PMT16-like, partial [Trifolium medium]|nr:putative methyltransferase PMT16-like [Trifolium medium]
MKSPINLEFLRTTHALKIGAFFFISITFFYLGKHWSDGYQQLIFFTQDSDSDPNSNHEVSISPNFNKSFNVSSLIDHNDVEKVPEKTLTQPPPAIQPPPPPPATVVKAVDDSVEKFGIVNENGTMSEEFEVGSFDPEMVDDWVNETQ